MNENFCIQHRLSTELLLGAVPEALCPQEAKLYLTHQDVLEGLHLAEDAPSLPIEIFGKVPVIALRKGNDTRIRMDALCQEAGVTPQLQLEVDQLATAYNIACSGLGMTLVSDTLLRSTMAYPDMRYFKLQSSLTERPVYLYHKRARYVTRAMQEFLDTAAAVLAV
jgi:DNA-binding transcriptional LysR family regulator